MKLIIQYVKTITVEIPEKKLFCISLCTKLEGEGFSISRQATRSLVVHFNKKLVTLSHYHWSLAFPKYICT